MNVCCLQVVADTGSVDFGSCVLAGAADCAADPEDQNNFQFTAAVCLTPTVSSVVLNSGEHNLTALPLEGFDGAELTIAGAGFSDNSCQNQVTIGSAGVCIVSAASASELTCTVNGTAGLESLKSANINVNVLNGGSAVFNVADPATAQFNLVPRVDTVNAVTGSWAGGNLFVLSGSGLLPFGGQQTVMITFGAAPYSLGCTVTDVQFDYISCIIPDFTTYQSGNQTTKEVPVTVGLGYDQTAPVYLAGNLTYTYDQALTSSADSMSPTTVSSSETVVVEGSNFGDGSTVKVFLRNKKFASMRRRRSVPVAPVVFHEIEKRSAEAAVAPGAIPSQWRLGTGAVKAKCLGGSCPANIFTSTDTVRRYRREADPLAHKYLEWAEESLEILHTEVNTFYWMF